MIKLMAMSVESAFASLAKRDPYIKYVITEYIEHFKGADAPEHRAMAAIEYPREYYGFDEAAGDGRSTESEPAELDKAAIIMMNDSDAEDDISASALILTFFMFYLMLLFDSGIAHYMIRPAFVREAGWVVQLAYIASIALCMLAVSLLSMSGAAKAPHLSAVVAFVCMVLSAQFIAHVETLTGYHGVAASIAIVAMCIWAVIERHWHRRIMLLLAIVLAVAIFIYADGFQFIDTFNEIESRKSRKSLVMLYFLVGGTTSLMMAFSLHAFSIMPSPTTKTSIAIATGISALSSIVWGIIAIMVFYLGRLVLMAAWEELKKFSGASST